MADPPGTTSAQQTCLACILCLKTVAPGIGLCLSSAFSVDFGCAFFLAKILTRVYFWNIDVLWPSSFFWIHKGLVPAKNHFQPRFFSSQPAFPAWSVIQETTFSMREGKPFWNGRAPGKSCFQPRAYSRQELFPALYSFQPHSDHPI